MRNLRVYEEAWPLHTPFVIARGSRSEAKVVVVEIEENGVKGTGECTPYPRYGESIASVMAQIMAIGEQIERGVSREQIQHLLPPGAARNAVDCALWDCQARSAGKSIAAVGRDAAQPGGYGANGGYRHAGPDGGERGGAVGKRGHVAESEARRSSD